MNDTTNTAGIIDTADVDILRQQIRDARANAHTYEVAARIAETERNMAHSLIRHVITDNDDYADELREWADGDEDRAEYLRDLLGFSMEREYEVEMTVTVNLTMTVTAKDEDDVREIISGVEDDVIDIDTCEHDGWSVSGFSIDSPDIDSISES